MQSTQVNFRIPAELKTQAQKKAEYLGLNLSEIMKIFLEKFTKEDVLKVQIQHDVEWEKIFNQGVKSYFLSSKGKKTTKAINKAISEVV